MFARVRLQPLILTDHNMEWRLPQALEDALRFQLYLCSFVLPGLEPSHDIYLVGSGYVCMLV